jgi:hypothetical protein
MEENKLDNFLGKLVVVTMDTNMQSKGIFLSHDKECVKLRMSPLKDQPMIFALDIKSVRNITSYKVIQERERLENQKGR